MAKLTRKHQKIFAGGVSATGVISVFGSYAAGSAAYSDDPDTIQSTRYGTGWTTAVTSSAKAPAFQDMNALFFLLTRQLAYLFQEGISEYNAATTYYIGSLVNDGSGNIYRCVYDGSLNNALSNTTYWAIWVGGNKIAAYGGNMVTAAADDETMILTGAGVTQWPVLCIIPTASAANKGRIIRIKSVIATSQGHTVTIQAATGTINGAQSATLLTQYTTKTLISSGSEWVAYPKQS